MPVDGSVISYTVTATNTSDTTKKTSLELDPGETEFEIKLIEGTYTLSVEGFLGEGESRKKILRGTYRNAATNSTVTIDKEHPNPKVGKIYVNPFFDEGGTGTVSLAMTLSGCGIKSVKAVWKKQGADGMEKTATFDKGGSVLTEIFFGGSESESEEYAFAFSESESTADIPSGIYEVAFSFYNDATQQDEVHKLFSCTHSLNVYQNLTTGWWKSSTAGATYIADGKFTLTQEIINRYIRHKFYVDQSKKATSLNEGTWYAPFKSVKTAVEKIRSINDGEPFTVILLSDEKDESTTSYTSGNKAYIDIANTALPLAVTILGKDGDDNDTLRTINAALTADRTGSVMYIGENAAVTLKNIHITGGYSSYNTGSGVINKGTLTMKDCTVSGCIATHCGGGGIGNFGTLSMNTCTVSGCTAEISGGAIFSNGTLTVKDCTISSCEADWGGGISNGKTGTLTVIGGSISLCKGRSSSGGGGIYSQGTLTVTGCTISGNESYNGGGIRSDVSDASVTVSITDCEITCSMTGGKGGGISNKGPLTVTGCTIICDGTSGTSGLGIYNEGGTADIPVTVTDCTISGRKRVGYGGGIYNTGTLIVTGGTISSCEATKGGGIWNGGTLTVSGTSISSCKATGYSDSCGGAIFSNGGETAAVLIVEGSTKISGCTAAKIGGGVYILNSTFTISGSASIPSETGAAKDNDVFLASGKTITVKGTLTAESPVATISLDDSEYTADRQVLQASDGGAITSDICEKFAVAQDPNGIEWSVTPDGTGTKGVLRNSTFYVRGAGAGWYTENPGYTASAASDTNSGSKSAPFATIQKALAEVNSMNDGTSEYTIYVDGTITDSAAGANGMADISPTKALNLKIQSMSAATPATLDAQNNGRVMNIGANAAVTLKNVNITGGNTADNGGGVYNEGSLTVSGGTITNCTARGGGGVSLKDGTLTVENDAKINKNAANSSGGGVYVESGTFTMTSGEIRENDASHGFNGGGGVYLYSGTFIMEDGKIEHNTARGRDGCGVSVQSAASFTMKGGTISGNVLTVSDYGFGGGVYADGTFTMEGGTISGNTNTYWDSRGGGVCASNFRMGGSAFIPAGDDGTNDVYVTVSNTNGRTIALTSMLTTDGIVATIKPYKYELGAQVLSLADGSTTTIEANYQKFKMAEEGWEITKEGKLALPDIYVNADTGDNTNGLGTRTKPFATLQKAFTFLAAGTDENASYTIHVSGTVRTTNRSELSKELKAKKILITGETGADTDSITGDGSNMDVLFVSCSVPVKIQNIKITGGHTGISLWGKANVTLGSGAVVSGNTGTGVSVRSNNGGSTFTMTGGEIKENRGMAYGGGVFVSESSTFTMKGGTISSNKSYSGGGVCVDDKGIFIMSGGVISDNYASYPGGGVQLESGGDNCTFTMTGGTIKDNSTDEVGGGVFVGSGTFTMSGTAKISGNTAAKIGGGVVTAKTFTMEGGSIMGNNAANGGGIYIYNGGTFTMSGGTISGNTATVSGGGVHVATGGIFTMGGSALLLSATGKAKDNDVYLEDGQTIKIASTLTSAPPVATITPDSYSTFTQVLELASPSTTTIADNYQKFAVSPESDGTEWSVRSVGRLGKN